MNLFVPEVCWFTSKELVRRLGSYIYANYPMALKQKGWSMLSLPAVIFLFYECLSQINHHCLGCDVTYIGLVSIVVDLRPIICSFTVTEPLGFLGCTSPGAAHSRKFIPLAGDQKSHPGSYCQWWGCHMLRGQDDIRTGCSVALIPWSILLIALVLSQVWLGHTMNR